MLQLLDPTISAYFDRRFPSSSGANEQQKRNEFEEALRTSTTVYIGNLAFTTSDFQLYEVSTYGLAVSFLFNSVLLRSCAAANVLCILPDDILSFAAIFKSW